MSWQALEAIQDSSKVTDHTGLCILYAIARYADGAGVVGAKGRKTSPTIAKLAASARVHKNTVINWLPRLEAAGELEIERNGAGRGAWNKYKILLPMATNGTTQGVPIRADNGTTDDDTPRHDVPIEGDNGTTQDVPISIIERLDHLTEMVQVMALMVQRMAINGTTLVVPDTDIDTNIDTDKEKIYSPKPENYATMRQTWLKLFPNKPKPRETNQHYKSKAATRMSNDHFRANWRSAMERAALSSLLARSKWFDFGWFIKNDANYEKCLNGNYDDDLTPGNNGRSTDDRKQRLRRRRENAGLVG